MFGFKIEHCNTFKTTMKTKTKLSFIMLIALLQSMSLQAQYFYSYVFDEAGNRRYLNSPAACSAVYCGCPQNRNDWLTLTTTHPKFFLLFIQTLPIFGHC
jgi:hypothetical protein